MSETHMMRWNKTASGLFLVSVALGCCLVCNSVQAALSVDFDSLSVPAGGYWNGSDGSGAFFVQGVSFSNNFTDFGDGFTSWDGWAYSQVNDATTAGFGNQYAAYAGRDYSGTGSYAVAYGSAWSGKPCINLPSGERPLSICVTNTTYAALSMLNGDKYAKKFGWENADRDVNNTYETNSHTADFFNVTLTGYAGVNAAGNVTGSTTFYLADYRFENDADDYVVNDWRSIDLRPLGSARSIAISFNSSDKGEFGINTPTYAAFDNFATVPEPSAIVLLVIGSGVALVWRRFRRK